jgi:dienelactone hydrolase
MKIIVKTMTEKEIKIKTPDKHFIYGTLAKGNKSSKTLVILAHGLAGHQNEHIFFNGAQFLTKNNLDSYRFDFYSGDKGGRTMTDCGISTHISDLNTVLKYFRSKYQKVLVVGHSLGGMVAVSANLKLLDGIILWESSYNFYGENKLGFKYSKSLKAYIVGWGPEFLVSKKMADEWRTFPPIKDVASKISVPIQVIVAGKGKLKKAGQEYYKYAKGKKSFSTIAGASHNFNELGTEEKLFTETLKFIKNL